MPAGRGLQERHPRWAVPSLGTITDSAATTASARSRTGTATPAASGCMWPGQDGGTGAADLGEHGPQPRGVGDGVPG